VSESPERCLIDEAHRITGLPKRNIQYLAQKGRIPGASRLGMRWTFDKATLRRWAREGDHTPCQKTPTVEAKTVRGGRVSKSVDSSTVAAYEQAIGIKPGHSAISLSRR
jgi:hypothetical protein